MNDQSPHAATNEGMYVINVGPIAHSGPLRAPYKAWRARYFTFLRSFLVEGLGWR